MDRVPNAQIRELCRVRKGLDESILWWFTYVGRDRIAKRFYVVECADSCSVGRSRKRWIDTVRECLKKRGLDVMQARRMVQDRS